MSLKKLPSNDYPVFEFEIPSTKKVYKFRPFLVKETKALLIAQGTEDKTVMVNTLKSVLKSACLDKEFDPDTLAIFDCEFLLLKLRSVSVGNFVTVMIKCDGKHENGVGKDCRVNVDLNNIEVVGLEEKNKEVRVSDNSIVYLRYPSIETLSLLKDNENLSMDELMKIVISCVDKIFINDEMYAHDELEESDIENWINMLPNEGYTKLVDFFSSIPYVRVKVEFDCPICKKHNVRYLTGLEVFF
jgi:hypothetical protein